jgi:putative endonuclease
MAFVYIISNSRKTTFYVGVTSDLEKRIYEHKNRLIPKSFSSKYNLDQLLYWEIGSDIIEAIQREKQLKNWKREWKINLIKTKNPELIDLTNFKNYSTPDPESSSG